MSGEAMIATEQGDTLAGAPLGESSGRPLDPSLRDTELGSALVVKTPAGSNVDAEEPSVGSTLGRYVMLGRIGRGGMGTVYKAYDGALDRAIAVKLLHHDMAERHTRRLSREAQALAKLSHPNVVHVYETGEAQGRYFIAMELVRGQNLREWQERKPSWRECIEVYLQAGDGLAAAHARGLVHRDFKPDNCLIDEDGRVKVLDFGLVRWADTPSPVESMVALRESKVRASDEDPPITRAGTVLGTLAYMPLEQLEGKIADDRSDQFGFCVSLYEAVYGERPFTVESVPRLMVALVEDDVRPAPRGTRVPARLRRALLRGLASEPSRRWPSMQPLLDELRALLAPRRKIWPMLVFGGGLAALGVGLTQLAQGEPPCQGSEQKLDGVWDAPRRQQVEAAIMGTGLPYAADTWERVATRLDDYAAEWAGQHREICLATSVRKEQSTEVMDLRMACVARHRLRLREAVGVLAQANETRVARAVDLVAGLPSSSQCDDVGALQDELPPPDDPAVAEQVAALRQQLARVHSLVVTGEYEEGLAEVEQVVEQAEVLDYGPLRAEASLQRGIVREASGQYVEAEADLERAYLLAAELSHAAVEAESVSLLTGVVGLRQGRYEQALQWGKTALALTRGRRSEPVLVARALRRVASVHYARSDLDSALGRYQESLAIEREIQASSPDVGTLLNNIGAVHYDRGDYGRSLEHHREAQAIWSESLGSQHPNVGSSLNNIGEVLHKQGKSDEALRHFEQAQALWEQSLGPYHPHVAVALCNAAQIRGQQGRHADAEADYRRAVLIRQQSMGEEHPLVAAAQAGQATMLLALGRHEDAVEQAGRALRNSGSTGDRSDSAAVVASVVLAEVALARPDWPTARSHAERAVALAESANTAGFPLAQARWVLARALWPNESQQDRSRRLAERARDAVAHMGTQPDWVEQIDRWLASTISP